MARRKIEVEIIGNPRSLTQALGKSSAALDSFGAKMRAYGQQSQAAGRTIFRGFTLPVIALGAASVVMGLKFEKSMTNIRALVGASDAQMQDYREGVLELGKVVPQGPQELADALYFITSAGFSGSKALDVLTASAKAAAAGLGDTQTVADLVTSAVNVYGEAALPAARATDVLLATVREGKAEPAELAEALGRVVAPAQALGVAFGEVGGATAGLTLGGLDAAEAVTGLRGILGTLLKPSEKAKKVLDEAGLSMGGIRKQVDKAGLLPTLQMLRDRFGANKEALGKLFPNVRALNAFLSLTGRNAKKNAKAMEGVTGSVGDTNKAFAEASEDASFRLHRAWSRIRVSLIQASETVIPIVADLADFVGKLLDGFNKFSPQTKKMIVGFVLIGAALGPLLLGFAALITIIGVIGSTVGVVIIALVAIGAALVYLWTQHEGFRKAVGEAWVWIQATAQRALAWYEGTLKPAIENVLTFLSALWGRFGDDIIAYVMNALTTVQAVLTQAFEIIRNVVELGLAIIRGDWSAAWGALKGIVRAQIKLAIAVLEGLMGAMFTTAKALGGALKDGVVAGAKGLAGLLADAFAAAINYVIGLWNDLEFKVGAFDPPGPGPKFGGVTIGTPNLPTLAKGAVNFAGGFALVGERGPELVNLPRGSDVITARQTRRSLGAAGDEGGLFELVITNWQEGRGYIRRIADDSAAGLAGKSRQRERMGASA